MGELTVIKNPFNPSNGRLQKSIIEGTTLRSIVESYQTDEFDIVCSVNGIIVEDLDVTLVGDDRVCVMARIKFGGGGGDGNSSKNILRTVAMIVVVAVATVVTAGGAAGFAGGAFGSLAAGSTSAAIAGAVISTAGMMLVNAILPPPTPSVKPVSYQSLQDGNTYGWDGGRNQINEGLTATVIYGRTKVYPQVISQYRDFVDNKDKLNVLFLLSEGECKTATPEVFINDRPIADFDGATVLYKNGTLTQTALGGKFDDAVYQKPVNVILDPDEANAGTLTVTTDGTSVEKLAIGVSIVGGLYAYADGGYHFLDTGFKAEFRVAGSSDPWTPFSGSTNSASWVSREQVQVITGYTSQTFYDSSGAPAYDGVVPVYGYEWQDVTKTKEFGENGFYFRNNTPDTIRATFEHSASLTPNQYEVRLTKLVHTKALVGTVSNLNQLRFDFVEERIESSLRYIGRTILAVTAVAQEELYGSAPVFTVIAEREDVTLYSGEWGNSSVVSTKPLNNPAWACYDLLTHPLYGAAIDPSEIVLSEFQSWADHCVAESLTVNAVFDNNMKMHEALGVISQLGHASVVQRGTKFGVIVDKVSPMVYLLGMGQILEGSFVMNYLERSNRANMVEITYYDAALNYERKMLTLGTDTSAQDLKASVNLIGCTNRDQAVKHADLLLRSNEHIIRTATLEAEIEAIHFQVGDVIGVSHDVPQYGLASGRVMSSTTTAIDLDHTISLPVGTFNVIIKHLDDTLETVQIAESNGDFSTLTLASGTWSQNPAYMSSYSVGQSNFETKLFRVSAIQKTQEFQAKVTLIEYNADIYNFNAVVPDYDPVGLPSVQNVQVTQSFVRLSDGSFSGSLDVTWDGFSTIWNVKVWSVDRPSSNVNWNANVTERRYTTTALPISSQETYKVRVTGLDGVYDEVEFLFNIDAPEAPVNLRYKTIDNFVFLNWEQPASELAIDRYEIYKGFDLATAELVGTTKNNAFSTYEAEQGVHVYHVIAVNMAGFKSDPATVSVPIASNTDYVAVNTLTVDGTGTINTMNWDGDELIGPYLESNVTWDDVWQSNYPVNYATKTWGDWPNDRGVQTWMDALASSGATSGSYVQTWDLGSLYPSTVQLSVKLNQTRAIGAPLSATATSTLEVSVDNATWASYVNVLQVGLSNFRYVRLTIDVVGDGNGAIALQPVITLNAKELRQSGKEDIDDLVTGTFIPFTVPFHDVQSIQITAKGTTSVHGAYDFNDVPNPTGFTAYLYDENNDRVFGDFSYTVVGF